MTTYLEAVCPRCHQGATEKDIEYLGHCGACESGLCDVQDDNRLKENEPESEEEK